MRTVRRDLQAGLLLLARLITGGILILHGWARWRAGIDVQTELLKGMGVPYPEIGAWAAVGFELLGGAALILGLGTRFVGVAMLIEQVAIVVYAKWRLGPYLNDGGWEANAGLAALGLVWLAVGSGRAGVDHLLRRQPDRERHEIDDADPVG